MFSDTILEFKFIDHQSVIIYSSEDAANKHRSEVEKLRASSSKEYSLKLVEEYMGPVLAQMSEL